MMKTMYRLGLVAVLAAAGIFWAFWPVGFSTTLGFVVTYSLNSTTNVVSFSVSGLPVLTPATAQYKIFINTGDGNYIEETIQGNVGSATLSKTYQYGAAGNYTVSAEATAVYDDKSDPDKKKPKHAFAALTVNPSSGSSNGGMDPMVGFAQLDATRRIVPGDPVTYIVNYQNLTECQAAISGNIVLNYDEDILDFQSVNLHNGETPVSNVAGTINYSFSNLQPGIRKNLFFHFVTKATAQINTALNPTPTLTFTYTGGGGAKNESCTGGSLTLTNAQSLTVADAHDPNYKTADLSCIQSSDGYLTYTINFQNDGYAAAKDVYVTDYLHKIFLPVTPDQFSSSHNISSTSYDPSLRKLTIELENINLPGLHDPNLGKTHSINDTKGWVRFRVALPGSKTAFEKQIIPNRAGIIFNCNPPVYTALELTPVYWSPGSACNPCPDKIITTSHQTLIVAGSGNIKPTVEAAAADSTNALAGYTMSGLFPNAFDVNDYYLVGQSNTDSCRVKIIHFTIQRNDCALVLNTTPTHPCGNTDLGSITASVSGGSGSYKWSDCTTGTTTYSRTKLPPGKYLVGVTDLVTQCTAEQWVVINPPNLRIDDDPNDCAIKPLVSGGTAPYTLNWNFDGLSASGPQAGQSVAWGSRKTASVTVTDASGCTSTLVLKKNCKKKPYWPYVIAALGLLTFGFLAWKFLIKKK